MATHTPPITVEIAEALGIPNHTTRAVLTLEAGKLPTLELTMLVLDHKGSAVVEKFNDGTHIGERLKKVQFMVRLEPFTN